MLSNEQLIELNRQGLIHAPDESDESFLQRARAAQKMQSIGSCSSKLFDINPQWISVTYENKGLRLWEGGCTWNDQGALTLQLRSAFKTKSSYLGYRRSELVTHELIHVARSGFEEPVFEEILAYQSSPSFFRRFLGPIFRTTKETSFFLVATVATFFCSLFAFFALPATAAMLALIGYGCIRLIRAQRLFARAKKQLGKVVGSKKALALMVRLTDREITRFAKMSEKQIVDYAKKMSRTHLRWQQITLAYFQGI